MGGAKTVVFVDRENTSKSSDAIRLVLNRLAAQGFSVHRFQSDRFKAACEIDSRLATRWPGLNGSWQTSPWPQRIVCYAIKSALVLANRNRTAFIKALFRSANETAKLELARYLDAISAPVLVLAHSAGAVAATGIERHPCVEAIIAFGYPFRHPDRPPQRYRTAHLATVIKPMLIVQGLADPYGADPAWFGQWLPTQARVTMVKANHDYANLPRDEFNRIWREIARFVGTDPFGTVSAAEARQRNAR